MKRAAFLILFTGGCVNEMMEGMEIMGETTSALPTQMDGLSDGRAVVVFSAPFEGDHAELIDPRTGQRKRLNIGSEKNLVMAVRTGPGDTILIITAEAGHFKIHKFTPDGVPRGKYVLENAPLPADFLVASGYGPKDPWIMTLNASGFMATIYSKTGKLMSSLGPLTTNLGPFLFAWMALVQPAGRLLVVPRNLRSNCGDCSNYIEGPIRVYQWTGASTVPLDSFPFLTTIDLDPLFGDANGATALAARGCGNKAYIFVRLIYIPDEGEPQKGEYMLVEVDPLTGAYEVVKTEKYEEAYWGDDGKLYDKHGNRIPTITCAAIKDFKLFLAYADGHVEVCEIIH